MAILMQGLVLLLAGMGIVYAFLSVLVLVMNVSSRVVPRFNHILPDDEPKKKPRAAGRAHAPDADDAQVAVAIAAAVARAAA
jgi:oxaloacetate decarboxylase (Na+ extruding) subunit gamma